LQHATYGSVYSLPINGSSLLASIASISKQNIMGFSLHFHTFTVASYYAHSFYATLCHRDESFALLQFKESFIIDKSASEIHVGFFFFF
jgi:hypothetical protein